MDSATLDGRLLTLDANTGELIWEVNTTDQAQSYTITGAPRVFDDKLVIGNGGAEYGVRGYVSAYDTESGEEMLARTAIQKLKRALTRNPPANRRS